MTSELYEKLTQLQWLLHKQQMRGWAAHGPLADTTRGQGRIIAMLKLRDGISTKDLSYLLGLRVSSLNELLSKLEKGGYATREPSATDKRVMLVKLTEKGRDEQQPEPFAGDDIFSCLSEGEQENLGAYLDRIIAALEASVGPDDEEICGRMEALRARLGDLGAFFEERGPEFPGGRGLAHGLRRRFGHDHSGHDRSRHDRSGHDHSGRDRSGRGGFPGGFRNHDQGRGRSENMGRGDCRPEDD